MDYQENLPYKFIEKLKSLDYISKIYLFGSRARGEHHDRSDIDLAIIFDEPTTDSSSKWSAVLDIIEDADTLLKIDCLNFANLKDNQLKQRIEKEKVVLFDEDIHERPKC